MILADKIIDLRKKAGWSQEELAERLNVSRQSISKWEGAQSVPDMNRILALADVFGVSTDYLLRDELEPGALPGAPAAEEPGALPARKVSMEEANAFLEVRNRVSGRTALGVMLCILSPIPLILLTGAQSSGVLSLSEGQTVALGLIPLFLLVAAAVALFLTSRFQLVSFEYMEKEFIDTEYGVDGMVRERQERYRPVFERHLVLGIVLCVLCALPLFFITGFYPSGAVLPFGFVLPGDMPYIAAVAVLLALVAVGVFLIVKCSMTRSSFRMLLEEGDYTRDSKLENSRNAAVSMIYWGSAVAGYLLWSFLSNRWDISWIVWPIAGVLYGVLCSILRVLRRRA